MRIKIILQGVPQAVQSARFAKIGGFMRSFQPKETVQWKAYCKLQAQQQIPRGFKLMKGPVRLVSALFVFPPLKGWSKRKLAKLAAGGILIKDTKPDLTDNLLKGCIDALKGVVYEDDSLIGDVGGTRKIYGEPARTELVFEEIEVDEDGFLVEPTTFGF